MLIYFKESIQTLVHLERDRDKRVYIELAGSSPTFVAPLVSIRVPLLQQLLLLALKEDQKLKQRPAVFNDKRREEISTPRQLHEGGDDVYQLFLMEGIANTVDRREKEPGGREAAARGDLRAEPGGSPAAETGGGA
eukprot:jgi/Mesen1/10574/ME000085S09907